MEVHKKTKIQCPNCGHQEEMEMPDYVCVRVFKCSSCQEVVHPKEGDCCVFCSYADEKCPSKQQKKECDDELNLEV